EPRWGGPGAGDGCRDGVRAARAARVSARSQEGAGYHRCVHAAARGFPFPSCCVIEFKKDGNFLRESWVKRVEFHLLDAGHFALESEGDLIARLMRDFLGRHVAARDPTPNQEV